MRHLCRLETTVGWSTVTYRTVCGTCSETLPVQGQRAFVEVPAKRLHRPAQKTESKDQAVLTNSQDTCDACGISDPRTRMLRQFALPLIQSTASFAPTCSGVMPGFNARLLRSRMRCSSTLPCSALRRRTTSGRLFTSAALASTIAS